MESIHAEFAPDNSIDGILAAIAFDWCCWKTVTIVDGLFDDTDFQLITCTNALHYFPNVDVTLREMRRVISPNGNLVITDWCRNYAWMRVLNSILPWTQYAHALTLSSNELEQSLSQAGFCINSETKGKIDWFWGLMTVHATPV